MIIDKEQLISLLEEKTGLARERVESQLEELIKRIKKAADKDKSFEIEGFGTFSMDEDKLQFEPSDTLETEINNKYAGMKPIELIGAFKEPEGDEVPEIDEDIDEPKDKVWAFDKEADEQEVAPDEAAEKEYSEETEEQEEPTTAEDKAEEVIERLGKMEKDQVESSGRPEDESAEEPAKEGVEEKEKKDNIGRFLVAAVIIIAIGLSGWVVYDTGLISGINSEENGSQAAQFSAQQKANDQEKSSSIEESSPQSSEESTPSEPEQELGVEKKEDPQPKEASEQEDVFGLKGEVNETFSDGYTIVVYSLRSMEEAEKRRQNFEEAGYRALIRKAEVQGTIYFRVGLGQFPTVDAAQQAVSDLPESYQSNQEHFIKRIQ